jgi:hypothetical protein
VRPPDLVLSQVIERGNQPVTGFYRRHGYTEHQLIFMEKWPPPTRQRSGNRGGTLLMGALDRPVKGLAPRVLARGVIGDTHHLPVTRIPILSAVRSYGIE